MNEYSCLGAELRCDGGRYSVVCHTDEARQAYKGASMRVKSPNPFNAVQMLELWSEVIATAAMIRCRRKLEAQGYDIFTGCNNNEPQMTCHECMEKGLDSFEGGCIFYDGGTGENIRRQGGNAI